MNSVHKVHLVNQKSLNTRYGFGEGRTLFEAITNALQRARVIDPNAVYDWKTNQVFFDANVVL